MHVRVISPPLGRKRLAGFGRQVPGVGERYRPLDLPTFVVFGSAAEKRGKGLQQRGEERQPGPTPNPCRRRSSHGGPPQKKQQTLGSGVGLRRAPRPGG
jgi:hypothetical protein